MCSLILLILILLINILVVMVKWLFSCCIPCGKNNGDDEHTRLFQPEDKHPSYTCRRVFLYDKWKTKFTSKVRNELEIYLKDVKLIEMTRQNEHEILPVIVMCQCQSRLQPDIHYSLPTLEECHSKHIILVLIHWKTEDIYEQSDSVYIYLEKTHANLTVLDGFLQSGKNNINKVKKRTKEEIYRLN